MERPNWLNLVTHRGRRFAYTAPPPSAMSREQIADGITLATIVVPASEAAESYLRELETMLRSVAAKGLIAPRADSILVRVIASGNRAAEIHGFRPLDQCGVDDYRGSLRVYGRQAAYDAADDAISTTADYARQIAERRVAVNGIVFVLADGLDHVSIVSERAVGVAAEDARGLEYLESLSAILVSCGLPAEDRERLREIAKRMSFNFAATDDCSERSAVQLASFIFDSIQAQSYAVGSGSAAPLLAFNSYIEDDHE